MQDRINPVSVQGVAPCTLSINQTAQNCVVLDVTGASHPGLSTSAVDPVLRALYSRHAVCEACDGIGIRIDGSVAGFPYGRCTTCGASVDPRVAA